MSQVLQKLTETIGLGKAVDVCRRWGGREFRIPVKVAAGDPLALTLGLETAQLLAANFGGQRLQLPAETRALQEQRNAAIWRACEQEGRSHESVGLEYGLTRPGVSAVLRKMREQKGVAA